MRFIVSGYYGCGNLGDEAVLAGIKSSFQRVDPAVELQVLSQNPSETTRLHKLPAIPRMKFGQVRKALKKSDLLISGGGSLLQDTTSFKSLLYYLLIIRLAQNAKKPVMFYAQGIGPLVRPISQRMVAKAALSAKCVSVRDVESRGVLNSIGVPGNTVHLTADPAFALPSAPDARIDEILKQSGIEPGTPTIGVALRPWGSGELQATKSAVLVNRLQRATGMTVAVMPLHHPDDLKFGQKLLTQVEDRTKVKLISQKVTPSELLGVTGRLQAVVGMRLHALIFSAKMNVPLFGLSYDPKVENFMKSLSMIEFCTPWNGFETEMVVTSVNTLLSHHDSVVSKLTSHSVEREKLAIQNAELAIALVG